MHSKHYDIKRKRTINFFLDAAEELTDQMDINCITIRMVADKAGFNSATIYNYFENFDQLIAFMVIRKTMNYLMESAHILQKEEEYCLDDYIRLWEIFCQHSFANPRIYSYAYSSTTETMENYQNNIEKFLEIFSDTYNIDHLMENSPYIVEHPREVDANIHAKNVKVGLYTEENSKKIYECGHFLYVGILNDAAKLHEYTEEEYTQKFMDYFLPFLKEHASSK